MWEFAPGWTKARMTKSQVKKYLKDMEKAKKLAEEKLRKAQNSWELEKEKREIEELEKELDNL